MTTRRRILAAQAKLAREKMKLTQSTAAAKLRISAASLAAYEQGTRDIPDAMVDAMAELYGVHPAVFRYGNDVLAIAANHETARQLREMARQLAELADTLTPRLADSPAQLADMPAPKKALASARLRGADGKGHFGDA